MRYIPNSETYLSPDIHKIRKIKWENNPKGNFNDELLEDLLQMCAGEELSIHWKNELKQGHRTGYHLDMLSKIQIPNDTISPINKLAAILKCFAKDCTVGDINNNFKCIDKFINEWSEWIDKPNEDDDEKGKDKGTGSFKTKYDLLPEIPKYFDEILTFARIFSMSLATSHTDMLVKDVEGEERQLVQMKSLSDLPKLSPLDVGFPNKKLRNLKIINNEPMIVERSAYKEKKQLVYILEDVSGSMGTYEQNVCAGIMFSFLTEVRRNNAEVYHRFFDTNVSKLSHYVHTNTDFDLFQKYLKKRDNTGGTDISFALDRAAKDIEKWKNENSEAYIPEIIIITDGDDFVNPEMDLGEIVLNYVNVNANGIINQNLISLSKKYNGKQLNIQE